MTMHQSYVLCADPDGLHRLSYVEWTPEGANPDLVKERTLICLHSLTGNGRLYDDLAQELASAGYRVICPDLPGRGASDWLSSPKLYTFPQYISDIVTLIARLDVAQVDWVGTSMGGVIGMMLAGMAGTPIRRLVLNDVGGRVPSKTLRRIARYVGAYPSFGDLKDAEVYFRDVYRGIGPLSDDQWCRLAIVGTRPDEGGGLRLAYDPGISKPLSRIIFRDVRLWKFWDGVTCPVLALRGSESRVLPLEVVEEMQRRGPGCKLVEFPGIGHAPSLMEQDQIATIRDWLIATA